MSFGMHGGAMGGGVPNPTTIFRWRIPSDGVSSLSWSPTANFLVATCWAYDADNVLCYEVQANGQAMPKAAIKDDAPVLCSAWSADGSAVFSGGCDNQAQKMGPRHEPEHAGGAARRPVRHCAWINEVNLLVTGSWDKTLKYWDTRQPNPAMQVQLPERCYALSVTHPLLVVHGGGHIQVYNLSDPSRRRDSS